MPERFEAGTLNAPGIAGLGAGVDFILERGIARIRENERDPTRYALEDLEGVPGITIYGPRSPDMQVRVISLNLPGVRPQEVASILDEAHSIMVRAGLHCVPMAHRTTGTGGHGFLRVGLGCFNTASGADQLAGALKETTRQS
ncbi:MAG: aminotransferase class V-fold PLP-dependent enzyme [Bacillota bacterium]